MENEEYYAKLSYRVAEERLLLREKRWIIRALEKIKHQRHCLEIERLHLESLKKQLDEEDELENDNTADEAPDVNEMTSEPSHRNAAEHKLLDPTSFVDNNSLQSLDMATASFSEREARCNDELLNLKVTPSVCNKSPIDFDTMEEFDSEDDCDNIEIDINMLMNGRRDDDEDDGAFDWDSEKPSEGGTKSDKTK